MVHWVYPSHPPKRHLDRFSRFCRALERDQQTHRSTDHATPSVAIGCYRISAMRPKKWGGQYAESRLWNGERSWGVSVGIGLPSPLGCKSWEGAVLPPWKTKPAVEDSNFAPGASTWRTGRNIMLSLILAHWPHYVRIWRHPRNRKYITYCTALSEED